LHASTRIAGTPRHAYAGTPLRLPLKNTCTHNQKKGLKNVGERNTTRNPMLLLRLSGSFLLRTAQRALSALLFHAPPRSTFQTA
jgi:hypothetical protein